MEYKIGEYKIFRYNRIPREKENQYKKGQFVRILDSDTKEEIAQYQVIRSNQFKILGQITNTYGHNRGK